ncbi:hypothetical protein F8388_025651 [Cannabis sativa]|uniref:Lysosomal Pro-X carboxypeptidase n=1 Tax=Cannabis sativa TaxID=3483 RepID=A0A7J6G3X7_CANSA|nr:hypothetical protein F8388_025651 [Cannabis sativa]
MKFSNISRSKILLLLLSYNILTINNIIASSSSNSSPKNNNFFTKIPRLSPTGDRLFLHNPETLISGASIFDDFETFFYNQTLDHFNYRPESYSTFEQRYLVNSKYWNNNNKLGPIFAYLGAEEPIDQDIPTIGFLTDNAPSFKALIVFIEHRYYGKSIPFGSREEAVLSNASTLGYFNSAQALTDYANILLHIKSTYQAPNSPIIVIGGSYGGMLASWFRLKYPHIALGALASSAPILYFDDITPQNGYYSIVTKDFREASENCYETILKSWSQIDKVAALPNGLSILTNKFKTCSPLKNSSELKDYLGTIYATAAQYNSPPKYPVNIICEAIDNNGDDDILDKIFSGLSAYNPNKTCYVNPPKIPTETDQGWKWQTCSEMVIPIGIENDTMFEAYPFKVEDFIKDCKDSYGVPPRPHWVTSYYGGHDIKLILNRFGSNIIFSNGLRDPYSSGGVLENISDSILAIKTTNENKMSKLLILVSYILIIIILTNTSSSSSSLKSNKLFNKIPRLGLTRDRLFLHNPETLPEVSISEDLETFFYNQTLDHFNYREESYTIFEQRYLVNSKYWGGPNAPIFAYLGAEASIDYDINDIGFINENAPHFKALIVFIENGSSLGYFNSAQALADYAHILLHINKTYKAQHSPIIVIGASYGGMLASWFRLKYPHIAHAAFASSAPILYFDDITPQNAYFDIVSKDFREVSESCYQTIVKSWSEIDKVGAMVDGLKAYFSNTNTTCYVNKPTNLTETDEGWSWQTCSEMVFPIGIGNNTMFESQPFDLQDYINDCKDYYGISPRPHWATTYYGGHV